MSWGEYIRQKSLKKMLWGREYDNIDARMSFVVDAVQQDIDAVHNHVPMYDVIEGWLMMWRGGMLM